MAKILYDKDVNIDLIRNETIAVIGYGIQGSAQACNMKDSGLKIIVGLKKDGASWSRAVQDGHEVYTVSEAAEKADIIHILVPDMVQASLYKDEIKSKLAEGKALCFSHGAAIRWRWILPPKNVDVMLVAPKAPGKRMREVYMEGFGVPSLVAVEKDYTGRAWDRILGIAKAIGSTRAGVIKTTFKEEVETDWFGEQVILCGGVASLIKAAFETGLKAKYQPEVLYFECLHELKLIVDLIQEYGISGMYRGVSETARYGGLTRGDKVIGVATRKMMKKILADIKTGKFAKEWVSVWEKKGAESFNKPLKNLEKHPIENVGRKLRKMMWPNEYTT